MVWRKNLLRIVYYPIIKFICIRFSFERFFPYGKGMYINFFITDSFFHLFNWFSNSIFVSLDMCNVMEKFNFIYMQFSKLKLCNNKMFNIRYTSLWLITPFKFLFKFCIYEWHIIIEFCLIELYNLIKLSIVLYLNWLVISLY